jgi:hypothetical protein
MPKDNQPSLLSKFIIDPIINANESNRQEDLRKTIKKVLITADGVSNHDGIVEQNEISEFTKKRIQEMSKRFKSDDMQKALDDVVKIATPGHPMLSETISPRINITQEALNEVQAIIASIKNPDSTPSNGHGLQANKAKDSKSRG